MHQEAVVTEEEATRLLAYDSWVQSIQMPLLELFSAFATADLADPKVITVSQTVYPMCTYQSEVKKLDLVKVTEAKKNSQSC